MGFFEPFLAAVIIWSEHLKRSGCIVVSPESQIAPRALRASWRSTEIVLYPTGRWCDQLALICLTWIFLPPAKWASLLWTKSHYLPGWRRLRLLHTEKFVSLFSISLTTYTQKHDFMDFILQSSQCNYYRRNNTEKLAGWESVGFHRAHMAQKSWPTTLPERQKPTAEVSDSSPDA